MVLGVSFNVFSPPENAPVNNLDITLVKEKTLAAPEQADYLAQANNEGGGETDEASPEPSPEVSVPLLEETPAIDMTELPVPDLAAEKPDLIEPAPLPVEPETPPLEAEPVAEAEPEVETVVVPTPSPQPDPKPMPADEKLTTESAERQVESSDQPTQTSTEKVEATQPEPPKVSAKQMMAQARSQISTLQSQLAANSKSFSEKPQKRRISAATKEFAAAAYMRSWEMKIERIGNMNYPQQAKDQNINGSLMLSVDIRPDGSVPANGIVVSRSSGYPVLDDAAIKIVRMGAPYSQIPENVLQDNDMLTIIRTWRFESQGGLSTR